MHYMEIFIQIDLLQKDGWFIKWGKIIIKIKIMGIGDWARPQFIFLISFIKYYFYFFIFLLNNKSKKILIKLIYFYIFFFHRFKLK